MIIQLKVLVVPKSSKNKIIQLDDDSLKIFVSAPANGGQANEAVVKLVAKWKGVPQKAVSIIAGHHSRRKTLKVNTE